MNFALSDEQGLLREAARGALSRVKTVEAARAALEEGPSALPDLWPTVVEAGWTGILIDEDHGGAGLGAFDAMLVAEECGRVLASVPLLGLLPASAILNAAGDESLPAVASGELRPVYVPARPPGGAEPRSTGEPSHGLIAAESLGAVQTCLEMSVAYAKERFTFGRAIGSYQAIKHELTEVLRQQENARGLEYYAGWARESKPDEFPLAASAARSAAGKALDFAARSMINVHGGIGATWEHDAPLFFRRAELSRRLLGGTHDATDRVAEEAMAAPA